MVTLNVLEFGFTNVYVNGGDPSKTLIKISPLILLHVEFTVSIEINWNVFGVFIDVAKNALHNAASVTSTENAPAGKPLNV